MKTEKENFSSAWIYKHDSRYNWDLYWHQLDLVMNKSSLKRTDKIYEIGVGSGLTSGYLKQKGFTIQTIDIDKDKNPDITADITSFEFPDASCYIAFEVFEHIPFEEAKSVWEQFSQKGIKYVIISLPYAYKTYLWANLWSPFFGEKSIRLGRKRNKINATHHYWELGYKGMNKEKIIKTFKEIGYSNSASYRYRSHHFFMFNLNNEK